MEALKPEPMSLACTDDELCEVTGKVRPSAQARILRAMGIEFIPRPDGTLLVAKERVLHLLGVKEPKSARRIEPDWSALAATPKA